MHKISIDELLNINANGVANKIPSRLVVGMASCQLTRVQTWLEHFLSPLAKFYGSFEFIKDSNDFLLQIEEVKLTARNENWDWNNHLLFTIDVKALYPSVQFKHLVEALQHCFNECTNWEVSIINLLIDLIMYTLKHQQILWNEQYYMLNKGIPTGGKHSVPLANILLSFIFIHSLNVDIDFKAKYDENIKLWNRFIDDCGGIYHGDINEFLNWFKLLQKCYKKFDLELTCDTDLYMVNDGKITKKTNEVITFLDIDVFKSEGTVHTKEHRKQTSANSYLHGSSAHPRYTFPGIIKSQLYRLRRLCSRDIDFKEAVNNLKLRCINSGYKLEVITEILSQADNLVRCLVKPLNLPVQQKHVVRLVTLAGTTYEKEFSAFASRMNAILIAYNIHIEIVKSTFSSISQLLFNNNDKIYTSGRKCSSGCIVCTNNIRNETGVVESKITGKEYKTDNSLCCVDGGIYVVNAVCSGQYTGKTTNFGNRSKGHFVQKSSSIYTHKLQCKDCKEVKDFSITYVEDYQKRGKYSLSEREFLWNFRIKGNMNTQKTLKS